MTLNRQSILLILMLLFILGGGFYYFFMIPLKQEEDKLQQELIQQRTMLQTLQKASVDKEGLEVTTFPPNFQQHVPEAPYLEQIMLDMTQVETVSGVDMDGIGLSTGEDQQVQGQGTEQKKQVFIPIGETQGQGKSFPGLEQVSVSTKIKGTYEQIYRFFQEVLTLPRLFQVQQVKVTSGGKSFSLQTQEEATETITVEVTLTAYYAPLLKPYFEKELPIIAPQPANKTNPFN